ncbi:hypothetical protein ACJX0J_038056, partial [Zea mays]
FIPFHGGPQNCVGDQFTFLELVRDQNINMTVGAMIHTTDVRKHDMDIFSTILLFFHNLLECVAKANYLTKKRVNLLNFKPLWTLSISGGATFHN